MERGTLDLLIRLMNGFLDFYLESLADLEIGEEELLRPMMESIMNIAKSMKLPYEADETGQMIVKFKLPIELKDNYKAEIKRRAGS